MGGKPEGVCALAIPGRVGVVAKGQGVRCACRVRWRLFLLRRPTDSRVPCCVPGQLRMCAGRRGGALSYTRMLHADTPGDIRVSWARAVSLMTAGAHCQARTRAPPRACIETARYTPRAARGAHILLSHSRLPVVPPAAGRVRVALPRDGVGRGCWGAERRVGRRQRGRPSARERTGSESAVARRSRVFTCAEIPARPHARRGMERRVERLSSLHMRGL